MEWRGGRLGVRCRAPAYYKGIQGYPASGSSSLCSVYPSMCNIPVGNITHVIGRGINIVV